MTVAGVFSSGHYIYDNQIAFINIDDAKILFQKKDIDGYQLKLNSLFESQKLSSYLDEKVLNKIGLYSTDWTIENKTYFDAVKVEKAAMFIILMICSVK